MQCSFLLGMDNILAAKYVLLGDGHLHLVLYIVSSKHCNCTTSSRNRRKILEKVSKIGNCNSPNVHYQLTIDSVSSNSTVYELINKLMESGCCSLHSSYCCNF